SVLPVATVAPAHHCLTRPDPLLLLIRSNRVGGMQLAVPSGNWSPYLGSEDVNGSLRHMRQQLSPEPERHAGWPDVQLRFARMRDSAPRTQLRALRLPRHRARPGSRRGGVLLLALRSRERHPWAGGPRLTPSFRRRQPAVKKGTRGTFGM